LKIGLALFHLYIAIKNNIILIEQFDGFFEIPGAYYIALGDYNTTELHIGDPD